MEPCIGEFGQKLRGVAVRRMALAVAGCVMAGLALPAHASNMIMQQQRQLQMQQQMQRQQQQQQQLRRSRQEQGSAQMIQQRRMIVGQNQRTQMLILEDQKDGIEEDVLNYDEKPPFHYWY